MSKYETPPNTREELAERLEASSLPTSVQTALKKYFLNPALQTKLEEALAQYSADQIATLRLQIFDVLGLIVIDPTASDTN